MRGYHVHKDIWTAVVGVSLQKRDWQQACDPFAVAVMRGADSDPLGLGRSLRFEASAK